MSAFRVGSNIRDYKSDFAFFFSSSMATPFPEFRRDQYLERPLPSSEDSERVILGAILLDNALITQAIEHLKADDFYSPLHRRIYNAMLSLFESSKQIDPILISEELKKEGPIESIGGITTITNLTFGLPHFSNVAEYIKVVKDKSVVRNLIRTCNQITSEALAEEDDAEIILDHAEQMVFALAEARTRKGFAHVEPVAEQVPEKCDRACQGRIVRPHRPRHRISRFRRQDFRPAENRSCHRGRAAFDGKDRSLFDHCAKCGDPRKGCRRSVLAGNVERTARYADACIRRQNQTRIVFEPGILPARNGDALPERSARLANRKYLLTIRRRFPSSRCVQRPDGLRPNKSGSI